MPGTTPAPAGQWHERCHRLNVITSDCKPDGDCTARLHRPAAYTGPDDKLKQPLSSVAGSVQRTQCVHVAHDNHGNGTAGVDTDQLQHCGHGDVNQWQSTPRVTGNRSVFVQSTGSCRVSNVNRSTGKKTSTHQVNNSPRLLLSHNRVVCMQVHDRIDDACTSPANIVTITNANETAPSRKTDAPHTV